MKRTDWGPFTGVMSVLAISFAAVAIPYASRFKLHFFTAAAIYSSFILLLFLALLPGTNPGRALLKRLGPTWQHALLFLLFAVPYLIYAAGTGDFNPTALLRVVAVALGPPMLYLAIQPRSLDRFTLADLCVGLLLIWFVLGGWLRGVWNVPVHLDFMGRLLLIAVCATTWVAMRPVPHLNYRWDLNWKVITAAGLNFLFFALTAIPTGFLIGFTAWHPRWHGLAAFGLDYLEIFLFIALLEEMFFRGFLQSLLTTSLASALTAQVLVSILFGLFHILHAPFPNWRYVALATVAGWFYGEAYRRGGALLASALTHAMVDTVWRTWFTRT